MTGQPAQRTLLVIGGPGRSGTSLVAGLVSRLGYYIPQPELAGNASNPRGFGESIWPLTFHKRVMASADIQLVETRPNAIRRARRFAAREPLRRELAHWLAEQFEISDRIVIKDPRLLWFVEFYRIAAEAVGAQLGLLTMVRHPAQTVHSADMHYPRIPNLARAAGWINGALSLEYGSRTVPRAFVGYDALLSDWRSALTAAESSLSLDMVSSASDEQIRQAEDLVDPLLYRSRAGWADLEVPDAWQALADRTFNALMALASNNRDERAQADLDLLRERYRAEYEQALALVWSTIHASPAQPGKGKKRQGTKARPQHVPAEIPPRSLASQLRRQLDARKRRRKR